MSIVPDASGVIMDRIGKLIANLALLAALLTGAVAVNTGDAGAPQSGGDGTHHTTGEGNWP
ncbi:MAG: hypothetical protein R2731_00870 [Nocardioides sp.]